MPSIPADTRKQMAAYLQQLAARINEKGYAIPFIPADPRTGEPSLAYTVGLHVHRGYELAVSGLDYEMSCSALNSLAVRLLEQQTPPTPDMEVRGAVGGGYPLRLRQAGSALPFVLVRTIYRRNPPVWQAVWPDREGRFPGDAACTLSTGAQLPL
ncbi:DUF4262 domain-containing protein [Streptomyces kaniharaensis]|uniref:DUF4262 domain-containing protein n=1 Tax=Streptomyces kaniharaensis TaxID=212423 RepID=A0A6N7L1C7_9ACTN|nr:DUF4262 domain-containing protein [Streptomyces kaniharaensis]MQS17451.1 DUF4262 domain-containing protein [Streptomyces kaniharaensis]